MRVPPFERFIVFLKLSGVFIVGCFVGAAIIHKLHIAQFEAFYHLRTDLESKLEQYEEDIQNLSQYKSQHSVVKSMKLFIEKEMNEANKPTLDSVTEKEILALVREDLSIFIGQSIYDIDSDAQFARKLLNKKVYTGVLGQDYTIEIKTVLLVDNTLQIWMTVRKYAPKPN